MRRGGVGARESEGRSVCMWVVRQGGVFTVGQERTFSLASGSQTPLPQMPSPSKAAGEGAGEGLGEGVGDEMGEGLGEGMGDGMGEGVGEG